MTKYQKLMSYLFYNLIWTSQQLQQVTILPFIYKSIMNLKGTPV